jgi:uncharacterized membrane protein YkvA (DUF1232 family)
MQREPEDAAAEGERVLSQAQLPAVMIANARTVREGFWVKFAKVAGRIPFAEDLVAAYFAMGDRATPLRTRALLLAALAYFVVPTDFLPDLLVGLGFTDDATVLAMALGLVGASIKSRHRDRAREVLNKPIDPAEMEPIEIIVEDTPGRP